MWALALYDIQANSVIISRDQFGIKPLYYTMLKGGFSFASEMKGLTALDIPLEPNTKEFYAYFSLGYFIAPDTCYKDIFMLRPGELIEFNLSTRELNSSIVKHDSDINREPVHDTESVVEALDNVLQESVKAHYVSDVPVSILFSGGNDSALIAALSKKSGYSPVAYHLAIEGSTDTSYAVKIAKELGLTIESVPLTEQELVAQYEAVWDVLDVPFADTSIIPTSLIYKKIKGKSKVVLSGEGGDEWFGGYRRHRALAHLGSLLETNMSDMFNVLYGSSNFALEVSNPFIQHLRKWYLEHASDDVIGAYLASAKTIDFPLHQARLRQRIFSEIVGADMRPSALQPDRQVYLPHDLLFKNDIASMSSSIEARGVFRKISY